MPNPTHRHTRSRRNKRRANWKGELPNLSICPKCSEPKIAHMACLSCGTYNNHSVIRIVEKET